MSRSIADVTGVLVGHAHDLEARTGVTVVLTPDGSVGGVDVRGGAPGTRETDLLNPVNTIQEMHGVALCGGSAMGLAAVTGVVAWLREQGKGLDVRVARVPIVPAAVIFDLAVGRADRFPDEAMGYAACAAATSSTNEGRIGVGAGALIGKIYGSEAAMPCGVGSWSETLPDGTVVGALVVVNAFGDVYNTAGQIIGGVRDAHGAFLNTAQLLRSPDLLPRFGGAAPASSEGQNTTLAVVATNAALSKAETTKLAQMAQNGLARAIRPVHTPFDGDTVFSIATGTHPAAHMLLIGSVAADVLAHAIERAVYASEG